jgi:hypothetical protein
MPEPSEAELRITHAARRVASIVTQGSPKALEKQLQAMPTREAQRFSLQTRLQNGFSYLHDATIECDAARERVMALVAPDSGLTFDDVVSLVEAQDELALSRLGDRALITAEVRAWATASTEVASLQQALLTLGDCWKQFQVGTHEDIVEIARAYGMAPPERAPVAAVTAAVAGDEPDADSSELAQAIVDAAFAEEVVVPNDGPFANIPTRIADAMITPEESPPEFGAADADAGEPFENDFSA